MKEKPNLYEERMNGAGGAYNNSQNYLKGLDDMCIFHNMNETCNVLELGVNDGVSTSLFAYYSKSVVAINLNKSEKLQSKLNLYKNIKFYQEDIKNITNLFPDNYFDFIYIDANHHEKWVLRDINISLPKLKDNGILCGHDYIPDETNGYGVKAAVDTFFKNKKINIFEDTSWSIQIKKTVQ
jgi:predicted O-methyltransferase YrrM